MISVVTGSIVAPARRGLLPPGPGRPGARRAGVAMATGYTESAAATRSGRPRGRVGNVTLGAREGRDQLPDRGGVRQREERAGGRLGPTALALRRRSTDQHRKAVATELTAAGFAGHLVA